MSDINVGDRYIWRGAEDTNPFEIKRYSSIPVEIIAVSENHISYRYMGYFRERGTMKIVDFLDSHQPIQIKTTNWLRVAMLAVVIANAIVFSWVVLR